MNYIAKGILFYFSWIILHFAAAHLYTQFCVPLTLRGFVLSTIVSPSPQCTGLRWVINTGGDTINMMWFALGTAVMNYLVRAK